MKQTQMPYFHNVSQIVPVPLWFNLSSFNCAILLRPQQWFNGSDWKISTIDSVCLCAQPLIITLVSGMENQINSDLFLKIFWKAILVFVRHLDGNLTTESVP